MTTEIIVTDIVEARIAKIAELRRDMAEAYSEIEVYRPFLTGDYDDEATKSGLAKYRAAIKRFAELEDAHGKLYTATFNVPDFERRVAAAARKLA